MASGSVEDCCLEKNICWLPIHVPDVNCSRMVYAIAMFTIAVLRIVTIALQRGTNNYFDIRNLCEWLVFSCMSHCSAYNNDEGLFVCFQAVVRGVGIGAATSGVKHGGGEGGGGEALEQRPQPVNKRTKWRLKWQARRLKRKQSGEAKEEEAAPTPCEGGGGVRIPQRGRRGSKTGSGRRPGRETGAGGTGPPSESVPHCAGSVRQSAASTGSKRGRNTSSSDCSPVAAKRHRVEPSDVKHLPKPVSSGREGTTRNDQLRVPPQLFAGGKKGSGGGRGNGNIGNRVSVHGRRRRRE